MKTKIITIATVVLSAINLSAQQNKPVYTLCGKSGDCSMTYDEYRKCKKELITTDKNIKINSFTVSIWLLVGKDTVYNDFKNEANVFSPQTIENINKAIDNKVITGKIKIDNVLIDQKNKISKVPGMILKLN